MNIALCESAEKEKFNAGSKARRDVIEIAKKKGYKHIILFHNGHSRLLAAGEIARSLFQMLSCVSKDDRVLVQYPYRPDVINHLILSVLKIARKIIGIKVVVLIHDLSSLRSDYDSISGEEAAIRREAEMFKGTDYIICHNAEMIKKIEKDVTAKCINLHLFDYLSDGKDVVTPINSGFYRIVIAGNLERKKSGYIYELPEEAHIEYELYGNGFEKEYCTGSVVYHGTFRPDELISNLSGDFGLVWDGSTIETCRGIYGKYLRYNNPHKCSLYIAAGLPVIIWNDSALAEFVKKEGIGICVSSIYEIGSRLKCFSTEEYEELRNNVMKVRSKVIQGFYLSESLEQCG